MKTFETVVFVPFRLPFVLFSLTVQISHKQIFPPFLCFHPLMLFNQPYKKAKHNLVFLIGGNRTANEFLLPATSDDYPGSICEQARASGKIWPV